LVFCGTNFNAEPAARAVFNRHLNRVQLVWKLTPLRGHGLEPRGRFFEITLGANLCANRRVWTNHHALATLDTQIRFPNGHIDGDVALLPTRRPGGVSSVFRKSTDRQTIATARDHFGSHVTNELRSVEW